MQRERRGRAAPPGRSERGPLVLAYEGLDGVAAATRGSCFDPRPTRSSGAGRAASSCELAAARTSQRRRSRALPLPDSAACRRGPARPRPPLRRRRVRAGGARLGRERTPAPDIVTSNEQFNDWLNRSLADLHMMLTRDAARARIPTPACPGSARRSGATASSPRSRCSGSTRTSPRGVLCVPRRHAGDDDDPEQDAEPGKILHETRAGEMAALGEIPFGRYYGSVDATPLFVMLAGAYYERTGDLAFIDSIWPNVERALAGSTGTATATATASSSTSRRSTRGLVHQGWKDSHDSVFHADGTTRRGADRALRGAGLRLRREARRGAAGARRWAAIARAEALAARPSSCGPRFEERFWCEDLATYALALDGAKRPCRVRTSNAGHCLFAGIAEPERARRAWRNRSCADVVLRLGHPHRRDDRGALQPDVLPQRLGLAARQRAHRGRVRALRAQGRGRCRSSRGLFDASHALELHRLPELFCGFPRRPGEGPTHTRWRARRRRGRRAVVLPPAGVPRPRDQGRGAQGRALRARPARFPEGSADRATQGDGRERRSAPHPARARRGGQRPAQGRDCWCGGAQVGLQE